MHISKFFINFAVLISIIISEGLNIKLENALKQVAVEKEKMRSIVITIDAAIFGAMIALHKGGDSIIVEWIFIGAVILFGLSLLFLVCSLEGSVDLWRKTALKLSDRYYSDQPEVDELIISSDPKYVRCEKLGYVLLILAFITSIAYMIVNLYI